MYKIGLLLTLLLGVTFLFFGNLVYSAGESDNMTSTNFRIDTASLDPLGSANHTSGNSGAKGVAGIQSVIGNISGILLFIIPLIGVVSFLIAGLLYITSAGDSEKAGRAKTIIKWNIIAMFIAFLSYGIVSLVASFFNNP